MLKSNTGGKSSIKYCGGRTACAKIMLASIVGGVGDSVSVNDGEEEKGCSRRTSPSSTKLSDTHLDFGRGLALTHHGRQCTKVKKRLMKGSFVCPGRKSTVDEVGS